MHHCRIFIFPPNFKKKGKEKKEAVKFKVLIIDGYRFTFYLQTCPRLSLTCRDRLEVNLSCYLLLKTPVKMVIPSESPPMPSFMTTVPRK
jgi:hypothetical protein